MGHVDDAATILAVTIIYSVTFWARRQPNRLRERLGPFGKVGVALSESQGDIARWVDQRTLLAGVVVAALYGVGVVIVRAGIAAVLSALWSPWLAVAGGCLVGAAVVAPELWRTFGRKLTGRGH